MYTSALFHLHSILEGGTASISGYCYEARRFGVDVVWISDHDGRYFGGDSHRVPLDGEYELRPLNNPSLISLRKIEDDDPRLAARVCSGDQEWRGMAVMLPYVGKPQRPPLISRPRIELALQTNVAVRSRNRRIILRMHLSQTPPEHQPVFVDYVAGAGLRGENALPLPLADGTVRISLADDLQRLGWNTDHNLVGMELFLESRAGTDARLELHEISLQREISEPHDLLQAQMELADDIGEQYGVKVLVNYEASGAEGHMTCFGPPFPIPYDLNKRLPGNQIAQAMKDRGGVVSINHPFSGWKREQLSEKRKQELVQEVAQELIRKKGYGAQLIEVGFPEGRHNFGVEYYLRLLDLLNLQGLRMTAVGVSDAHGNRSWEAGNNFANYLASPDRRPENLLAAMRGGNFYIADPVRVRGQFRIQTDQGKTMGDRQLGGHVETTLKGIPRGSEWRWIVDGRCVSKELTANEHKSRLSMAEAKHFVRAELWDVYERLILAANPIWIG